MARLDAVNPVPLEVVMFVGLQGAGKSSFYRARFSQTHLHISKDLWPNAHRKQSRQDRELRAALEHGKSVVVDNTNATREERSLSLAIAREFEAHIVAYNFESDLQACLERNARREGRARVPDVGLYATHAKLQPPLYEEGFDVIYSVRLMAPSHDFEVEPQPTS